MGRWLALGLIVGCGGHGGAIGTIDGAPGGLTGDSAYSDATALDHTIRVTLNDRPEHPAAFSFLVAFRDGDGPWQLANTPAGDNYTFVALTPTWSVAWTCNGADSARAGQQHWISSVTVAEFTVAERTSLTMDIPDRCTDRLPPVLAMTGAIANAPAGSGELYVHLLDQYVGAEDTYSMRARLGVHDLIVRKIDQRNDSSAFATVATFIERHFSVDSSQADLDLATAAPTHAFDVSVPTNTVARATTLLYTKSGTMVTLGRTTAPLQTIGLDPAQVDATDVFDQQVELVTGGQTTIMTTATLTPGPLALQPPPGLGSAPTAVVAETPYPVLQTTWPAYADAVGYTWAATQTTVPPEDCVWVQCPLVTWTALVSPGVAAGSPSYRMPDLAALPGWNAMFELRQGLPIIGYAEADTSSAGASDFPATTPPAAGTQRTFVRTGFTLLP